MQNVDTIIEAQWIIPVQPDSLELEQHAVVIHDGKIADLGPIEQMNHKYQAQARFKLDHHALIPGLVNAHSHVSMSLFRGLADDLPLMEWLEKHIWPAEARWVNEEFTHDGTLLAAAEMIKSGTTCINDMYFFPDITARVLDQAGMRACVGLIMIDFPTVWAADTEEYLRKGLEVHEHFRNNSRISNAFAPHAPYTVSDAPLQRINTLAEELDIPIHMHVHETAFEVQQAEAQNGKRPLQRLKDLGLLNPHLMAVHMTQLNDEEIALMAGANASVVHCPESNLKLASGFCPVKKLLDAGVNVALGTDGAASNNDLDMLGEMRSAALLAKAVAGDASALPAHQALRMATLNGAKALGLEQHIGSIEIGKSADLVAVDLGQLSCQPVYHATSQIVYAASRDQVKHVWVAGHQLLNNGVLTTIDEQQAIAKAHEWAIKVKQADEAQS